MKRRFGSACVSTGVATESAVGHYAMVSALLLPAHFIPRPPRQSSSSPPRTAVRTASDRLISDALQCAAACHQSATPAAVQSSRLPGSDRGCEALLPSSHKCWSFPQPLRSAHGLVALAHLDKWPVPYSTLLSLDHPLPTPANARVTVRCPLLRQLSQCPEKPHVRRREVLLLPHSPAHSC